MSATYEAAGSLVAAQAELDPIGATFAGISGYDNALTDFSPDGYAKRADVAQQFAKRFADIPVESARDQIAHDLITERLAVELDWFNTNDHLRDMSFAWSPMQAIRSVFDQMPLESKDDWDRISQRLAKVPNSLAGFRDTLQLGVDKGIVVARRQAEACMRQTLSWCGADADVQPFFGDTILAYAEKSKWARKLEDQLVKANAAAAEAFDQFARFLRDVYMPAADETDAVGRERYIRSADAYLGMKIDPDEVYAWGWQELARLETEINAVCTQIKPNASLAEVVAHLNDDHERWIHGEKELVDWLKGLLSRAIEELNGTTFDIPEELLQLDVRIPPPGGPANQYYVPPSEDFSRPGTYWYPTDGRNRFPIWAEISTAYHEGVPGHHLQMGWIMALREELSRYQRTSFISGHAEGWALYAERLMDEVGFLERPEYRLDMLINHFFRAARVVVDIGLHLGLSVPSSERFHPGETWTPELAHTFMLEHNNQGESFIASEIVRYLGIPGQAISYKLGERAWLDAREQAKKVRGSNFDLKAWHTEVLSWGPLGLDQLSRLSRAQQ